MAAINFVVSLTCASFSLFSIMYQSLFSRNSFYGDVGLFLFTSILYLRLSFSYFKEQS
jgi:hypothetical protein